MKGSWWLPIRLVRGASWRDHVRSIFTAFGIAVAVSAGLVAIAVPVSTIIQASDVSAREPLTGTLAPGATPLEISASTINLGGRTWYQYYVYGAQKNSPLPAGLKSWPQVGHSIVSPELAASPSNSLKKLLGDIDPTRLGQRILASPDELVSYTAVDQPLQRQDRTHPETVIGFGGPPSALSGFTPIFIEMTMFIALPAMLMLVTVLRLATLARARRTTSLFLAGLDTDHLARIYANEITVPVVAGCLVGAGVTFLLFPVVGANGWLGYRWWPSQTTFPIFFYIALGLIITAIARALCRRVVRTVIAGKVRTRSTTLQQLIYVIASVGLTIAIGFLGFTVLSASQATGVSHPTTTAQFTLVLMFVIAIISIALLGSWLTEKVGHLLTHVPVTAVFLGAQAAIFQSKNTGRLASFIAIVVLLFGFAPGFLGVISWSATGDPTLATFSINFTDVRTQNMPALVHLTNKRTVVSEAPVTVGKQPINIAIGNCHSLSDVSLASGTEIGACTGTPQLGDSAPALPAIITVPGLGAIHPSKTRLVNSDAWNLILPPTPRNLTWVASQPQGDATFLGSHKDSSYLTTFIAAEQTLHPQFVATDQQDSGQYGVYTQQKALITTGLAVGLTLAILSFAMTCVELRWTARRSVAMLAAIGTPTSIMRRATALQFTFPAIAIGLPAWTVGTLSGLAYMAIGTSPRSMFDANTWIPPALALLLTIVFAGLTGFTIGAGKFTNNALADR